MKRSITLRELRERAGMSQSDVARESFTTQSSISRFEQEDDVRLSTLGRYIAATGGHLRLVVEQDGELLDLVMPVLEPRPERAFRVIWQDPESRSMIPVGRLHDDGQVFTFTYTNEARSHPRFVPFPELEETHEVHRSGSLFRFFTDRAAMSAGTAKDAAARLGLAPHRVEPIELLARSWGSSPHNTTIQIVPEPVVGEDGGWSVLFLASGVRHVQAEEPAAREAAMSALRPGDTLTLRPEPDNEFDPHAVLIVRDGQALGYVPRYLTELVRHTPNVSLAVEHINGPETSSHLRLLCRLSG